MTSPRANETTAAIPEAADLHRTWGISRTKLARTQWGLVNTTYFVTHPGGDAVLRIYGRDKSEGAIRFEHELLRRLRTVDLPFATPATIATSSGGSTAEIATSAGRRTAALFDRLAGEHPDDDDVAGIAAAAEALATLDVALASLDGFAAETPVHRGDILSVHPAVRTLDDIEAVLGSDLSEFVASAAVQASIAYRSLRRQLIHDDFALGNVLLQAGRVVGFLDFENAGSAPRAMEIAGALRLVLSKGSREALWRPFIDRYLSTLPLAPEEVAAVPALVRMREAIVLVWWCGRHLEGACGAAALARRCEQARDLARWTAEHGQELVTVLHRAR